MSKIPHHSDLTFEQGVVGMAMTFDDLVDKAVTRLGWQSRLTARPYYLLWKYTRIFSINKFE